MCVSYCIPANNVLLSYFSLLYLNRAGYLVYLVERAKKCLDFSATLYIIHTFICIIYGGWPSSLTWWVVNVSGLAVMALLGEYLCIRRELREIPIARYRASKPFIFYLLTTFKLITKIALMFMYASFTSLPVEMICLILFLFIHFIKLAG